MVEINLLTIKGNGQQTHTRTHSEDLIDYSVIWLDPARETEVAEGRKDEVWEPIPPEGDAACHGEEGTAGHFPGVITKVHQSHFFRASNSSSHTVTEPVPDSHGGASWLKQ